MVRSLVLVLVSVVACAGPGGTSEPMAVAPLRDLPTASVRVGDSTLTVAVAATAEQRRQGLRGVTDLGRLDGLVFVFPAPTTTRFTMLGVSLELDLAFIDPGGRVLEVVELEPCQAEPCPAHESPGAIGWALETPRGGLSAVGPGDSFSIEP